jgi:hypothetical protein
MLPLIDARDHRHGSSWSSSPQGCESHFMVKNLLPFMDACDVIPNFMVETLPPFMDAWDFALPPAGASRHSCLVPDMDHGPCDEIPKLVRTLEP